MTGEQWDMDCRAAKDAARNDGMSAERLEIIDFSNGLLLNALDSGGKLCYADNRAHWRGTIKKHTQPDPY